MMGVAVSSMGMVGVALTKELRTCSLVKPVFIMRIRGFGGGILWSLGNGLFLVFGFLVYGSVILPESMRS